MTTDERLEALERELAVAKAEATRGKRRNRRLLTAVGLAAGVFALVWVIAAAATRTQAQGGVSPTTIRASQFILTDEKGKCRAVLNLTEDGPALVLTDESNKPRGTLNMGKLGPALGLFDESGRPRVMLKTDKHGPALDLLDENGRVRAMLGAGRTRTPDGKNIAYPESSLVLFGPDGQAIWRAP